MTTPQHSNRLLRLLQWCTVILIVKVAIAILLNYRDYFPPNFKSLFLEGRETRFWGTYSVFFYIHICSAPFALLSGLCLFFERMRLGYDPLHRLLGRAHVFTVLILVVPSSMVMATDSFAGWKAGLSFFVLSLLTGACAALGLWHARSRRIAIHRRWMIRCYVLLCSAIVLRLISGAVSLSEFEDTEIAYYLAAWASWVVPIAICEIVLARKAEVAQSAIR